MKIEVGQLTIFLCTPGHREGLMFAKLSRNSVEGLLNGQRHVHYNVVVFDVEADKQGRQQDRDRRMRVVW